MPQATREIKRRIRSIKSTRQITKAMELVSAAKMRRAVTNVLMSRSYSNLAWRLSLELKRRLGDRVKHDLLLSRHPINTVAVLMITSNRGLCGGFNNQIATKVTSYVSHLLALTPPAVEIITLGKRGRDIVWRQGYRVAAEFIKPDITTKLEEIYPVVTMLINDYLTGRYDKIILAYTDFISALAQKPRLKQLLPIQLEADAYLGSVYSGATTTPWLAADNVGDYEYLFEPSTVEVLRDLLPRLLEVQIYQAVLESDAAEHSARMVAMRNASDAAKDMVDDLTLAFNQARQASITAELADITGGRVALGS